MELLEIIRILSNNWYLIVWIIFSITIFFIAIFLQNDNFSAVLMLFSLISIWGRPVILLVILLSISLAIIDIKYPFFWENIRYKRKNKKVKTLQERVIFLLYIFVLSMVVSILGIYITYYYFKI